MSNVLNFTAGRRYRIDLWLTFDSNDNIVLDPTRFENNLTVTLTAQTAGALVPAEGDYGGPTEELSAWSLGQGIFGEAGFLRSAGGNPTGWRRGYVTSIRVSVTFDAVLNSDSTRLQSAMADALSPALFASNDVGQYLAREGWLPPSALATRMQESLDTASGTTTQPSDSAWSELHRVHIAYSDLGLIPRPAQTGQQAVPFVKPRPESLLAPTSGTRPAVVPAGPLAAPQGGAPILSPGTPGLSTATWVAIGTGGLALAGIGAAIFVATRAPSPAPAALSDGMLSMPPGLYPTATRAPSVPARQRRTTPPRTSRQGRKSRTGRSR
jgi:hypothetical protein